MVYICAKFIIIIIFICQKTGQQGTKYTESSPTNKQNILDLQKQIARQVHAAVCRCQPSGTLQVSFKSVHKVWRYSITPGVNGRTDGRADSQKTSASRCIGLQLVERAKKLTLLLHTTAIVCLLCRRRQNRRRTERHYSGRPLSSQGVWSRARTTA